MSRLHSHLQKLKVQKFKELEEQFASDLSKAVSQKEAELNALEKAISQEVSQKETQMQSDRRFKAKQSMEFEVESLKQKILRDAFEDAVRNYLSDGANLQNWLAENIQALPESGGKITAGKSYNAILELVQGGKYEVVVDNSFQEDGFLFESDEMVIDSRLSKVVEQLYQGNMKDAYTLVYGL